MVSLAKSLEKKPFHLIASYCQGGNQASALSLLKRNRWSPAMKNVSVMRFTDFPKAPVKYVPYYLIFDHTGQLRYNHMGGPYHGGDGNNYQKLVAKLLKEIPPAQ